VEWVVVRSKGWSCTSSTDEGQRLSRSAGVVSVRACCTVHPHLRYHSNRQNHPQYHSSTQLHARNQLLKVEVHARMRNTDVTAAGAGHQRMPVSP